MEALMSTTTTSSLLNPYDLVAIRSFHSDDGPAVQAIHDSSALGAPCSCFVDIQKLSRKLQASPSEHVWVAHIHNQLIGAVAVSLSPDLVANIHCLRVDDAWHLERRIHRLLVQTAAALAREKGALKLLFHAQVDASRAAEFFHHLGFEFSRHRHLPSGPVLEFYLNLYTPPEIRTTLPTD